MYFSVLLLSLCLVGCALALPVEHPVLSRGQYHEFASKTVLGWDNGPPSGIGRRIKKRSTEFVVEAFTLNGHIGLLIPETDENDFMLNVSLKIASNVSLDRTCAELI